jgi:hypothetical protein
LRSPVAFRYRDCTIARTLTVQLRGGALLQHAVHEDRSRFEKAVQHHQAMASVPWNYGDGALADDASEDATASLSP